MVLALGDNFYDSGVPTNEHDARFQETFEKVYTASSLMTPWYLVGGNHDHEGNISAEIEYSKYSQRWKFPSYYYSFTIDLPFGGMKAQFVMIDTVLLRNVLPQRGDERVCQADGGREQARGRRSVDVYSERPRRLHRGLPFRRWPLPHLLGV